MSTIGILGANSQVGTEVCLHLSTMEGVNVVPICRTSPAAAFLRRCGLECRIGDLSTPESARTLLEGCDTVVELSRPAGEVSQILTSIRKLVSHAIEAAPGKARYVFVSSIMAFGFEQNSGSRTTPFLSRIIYGRTKRYGERVARRLGRRAGREVYVLRLGDVHGELQNVSRIARTRLRDEKTLVPAGPSYVVFAHTVAHALKNIADGKETPGRYTLVAEPALSWKELHKYYCRGAGIDPVVEEYEVAQPERNAFAGLLSTIYRRREMLASYVLYLSPRLESHLRAIHARRRARSQIEQMNRSRDNRPFKPTFVGTMPGQRLKTVHDDLQDAEAAARLVQGFLQRVARGCRMEQDETPA